MAFYSSRLIWPSASYFGKSFVVWFYYSLSKSWSIFVNILLLRHNCVLQESCIHCTSYRLQSLSQIQLKINLNLYLHYLNLLNLFYLQTNLEKGLLKCPASYGYLIVSKVWDASNYMKLPSKVSFCPTYIKYRTRKYFYAI